MTVDGFREEVTRVAHEAGVPAPHVEARRRVGGMAATLRRGHTAVVRVGGTVLSAPAEVQRHIAAHEVAHIALGHVYLRRAGELAAASVLIVGSCALLALSATTFPDPHPLMRPLVPVVAAVALVVLVLAYAPRRRQERDADVFAGQMGAPLTADVVEWAMTNRWTHRRTPTWMLTHPKWPDRLHHVRQQAGEASRDREVGM